MTNRYPKSFRLIICALLAGALNCLTPCVTPVSAESNLNYTSDDWIDARYDWVIYLNPKEIANFLNYPTSGLHPGVNVSVNYRVASRFHPKSLQQVHYEDLWYHGKQPIGCRSFSKLEIGPGWQGAIVIPPSSSADSNAGALANTIARLLLDVKLKKCNLVVVFADYGLEKQLCDQLGQFKFFRTDDDALDSPGTLRFFVSTGDIKDRTFLVYRPRS